MGAHSGPRVLQISHDYLGPFVSVCRQYALAFENGDVTTLYLRGEYSPEVEKETGGDRVLFFSQKEGSLKGFKIKTLAKLYKIFRDGNFDIVVAHRYKPLYLAGVLSYLFKLKDKSLLILGVIHEHGVLKRLHRKLFLSFWCRAIKVIAVSNSVKQDLEKDCPALTENERLFVLSNSMDVDRYESQVFTRELARQKLNLSPTDFIVGSLGRLVTKKQQDVLIRSMQKMDDNTRLVLIGDGPLRKQLEMLSDSLGLGEKIIFSGHKDSGYRYLKAFDVFVLPSGASEAFGYVLLEAMMAGIPMIIADNEGPMEVVGDSALEFRNGDPEHLTEKIRDFRQLDAEEIKNLTDKASDRLNRHFSLKKFSHDLLSLPPIASRLKTKAHGK